MDQPETRRVATTLPLTIDRAERPAGFVLFLPAAEAEAMIKEGRAVDAPETPHDDAPAPTRDPEPQAPSADQHEEH